MTQTKPIQAGEAERELACARDNIGKSTRFRVVEKSTHEPAWNLVGNRRGTDRLRILLLNSDERRVCLVGVHRMLLRPLACLTQMVLRCTAA